MSKKQITNKYTSQSHISTLSGVVAFFEHLLYDRRISFHPDDDFSEYVKFSTSERIFSDKETEIYNRLMDECFEVCNMNNVEIYSIGLASQRRMLMPNVKDPIEVGQLVRIIGDSTIFKLTSRDDEQGTIEPVDQNAQDLCVSMDLVQAI